jgi:hypothetical protein
MKVRSWPQLETRFALAPWTETVRFPQEAAALSLGFAQHEESRHSKYNAWEQILASIWPLNFFKRSHVFKKVQETSNSKITHASNLQNLLLHREYQHQPHSARILRIMPNADG